MENKTMERNIMSGEALDLSEYPKTADGDVVLPEDVDIEGKDLCLASTEQWIWSVGRSKKTGQVLASTSSKLYGNPDFECLWLR